LSRGPISAKIAATHNSASGSECCTVKIVIIGLFLAASVSLAAARDLALVFQQVQLGRGHHAARSGEGLQRPDQPLAQWQSVTFIMRAPAAPEMKLLLEKIYEVPESQVKEIIASANHGRTGHPAVMIVDSDEDLVNRVAAIPAQSGSWTYTRLTAAWQSSRSPANCRSSPDTCCMEISRSALRLKQARIA